MCCDSSFYMIIYMQYEIAWLSFLLWTWGGLHITVHWASSLDVLSWNETSTVTINVFEYDSLYIHDFITYILFSCIGHEEVLLQFQQTYSLVSIAAKEYSVKHVYMYIYICFTEYIYTFFFNYYLYKLTNQGKYLCSVALDTGGFVRTSTNLSTFLWCPLHLAAKQYSIKHCFHYPE
jgi:hypothetical protein